MKTLSLGLFFATALVCSPVGAQLKIGANTALAFATVQEGREILTSRDDFVQLMSPFDRAARLETDREVSEDDYLKFVGSNVLAWDDSERQTMTSAFQGIQEKLESLSLPFPGKILLIETTGKEEGGAEYTRANAIVFPRSELRTPKTHIQQVLAHELFHALSRANPALREKLYAAIGFEKCDEVAFPAELQSRKITNPDAPRNDHCARLEVGGRKSWAIPILFSSSEKYDVRRGGPFFAYLQFRFLLVDRNGDSSVVKPIYNDQKAELVEQEQVSGFLEQVGRNTSYTFHPEEILAENFSMLVTQATNLPSPQIIERMEKILKEERQAEPTASQGADKERH